MLDVLALPLLVPKLYNARIHARHRAEQRVDFFDIAFFRTMAVFTCQTPQQCRYWDYGYADYEKPVRYEDNTGCLVDHVHSEQCMSVDIHF